MDLLRSSPIQAPQHAMKIIRAATGDSFPQSLAQFFPALRSGEKSFQQRPQVKSGSTHKNRQASPGFDLIERLPPLAGIITGGHVAVRGNAIEQVMGRASAFESRGLGRLPRRATQA